MTGDRPTVAHLITPYLFGTGSWIHAQLVYNHAFRPIVITQGTEHLDQFPFDPVYDLSPERAGARRLPYLFDKYLLGRFPLAPYRRILDREHAGIVHAHLGWEGARTIGLARNPRRPFVVSFYGRDAGLIPRKLYWRILYKRLFRDADRVVVEGPCMARTLERIGAPPERIRVVRLGVPLHDFPFVERRPPEDPREPVIGLIAASFREKKGIPYALEALARVTANEAGSPGREASAGLRARVRLRIIGDGPLRPEIEERAGRPDLAGKVELLGYRSYAQYREELARAHFILAPSVTARDGDTEGGAPVCLTEGQAMGLPVVATTHCDIPDVTRPGESALLAPERDPEALADRLGELLDHPERWPAMGRAGRKHIEAEFDIRKQVERLNDVYRELST